MGGISRDTTSISMVSSWIGLITNSTSKAGKIFLKYNQMYNLNLTLKQHKVLLVGLIVAGKGFF